MSTLTTQSAAGLMLEPATDDNEPGPRFLGMRPTTVLKVAIIGALMALLFWPNLQRLWNKTNPFYGEANWSHAIAIPLIGLYYLYINREQLRAAQARTAWSGSAIAIAGILIFGWAIWPGQNDFIKDVGMVVTLFGIVTLLCGWQVMKTAWFPIAFLVCALPWPGLFYSQIAGPLQRTAAAVAVRVLHMTGVDSVQTGTKIFMVGQKNVVRTLNVAEACAGLRSLMTFIAVAAAVAFLSVRPLWQRLLLVASAVPIAIFCNMMRVAGQGVLDHYVSQQLSESFAHAFVGLIMLIPAFFLILLVGWILQNVFIEEVDDKGALRRVTAGRGVKAMNADQRPRGSTPAERVAVKPVQPAKVAAAPRAATAPAAAAPAAPAAGVPSSAPAAPATPLARPRPATVTPSRPGAAPAVRRPSAAPNITPPRRPLPPATGQAANRPPANPNALPRPAAPKKPATDGTAPNGPTEETK